MSGWGVIRATAIRPAPDLFMPTIEQYTALAEAMHDEDDTCSAAYVVPFSECETSEYDIRAAVKVLIGLHKAGWMLARDPAGTLPLDVLPSPTENGGAG
jgi:hypothetical protein